MVSTALRFLLHPSHTCWSPTHSHTSSKLFRLHSTELRISLAHAEHSKKMSKFFVLDCLLERIKQKHFLKSTNKRSNCSSSSYILPKHSPNLSSMISWPVLLTIMKFLSLRNSCEKSSSGLPSPLNTNLSRQHSFTSTTVFHIFIINLGKMKSITFLLSP